MRVRYWLGVLVTAVLCSLINGKVSMILLNYPLSLLIRCLITLLIVGTVLPFLVSRDLLFWRNYARGEQTDNFNVLNNLIIDLPVGILAVNAAGKLTICNKQAREILALSESCSQFNLTEAELPAGSILSLLRRTMLSGKNIDDKNYVVYDQDREKHFWVRTGLSKNAAGKVEGALLIFYDFTEQYYLEEQLRQADRLSLIGELAAGTAHEIRNPLTSIKGLVQLLRARFAHGDEAQTHINVVMEEINRIDFIINELLFLTKRLHSNLSFVDLSQMLQEICLLIEGEAACSKVKIIKRIPQDLPLAVMDTAQMKRVFLHLATNAVNAMPGGGELVLAAAYLTERERIQISFRDTGHGITREQLPHIFDPFFTTREDGIGLGLTICYRLVQNHGGTIRVISTPGQGSLFTIELPVINR